MNYIKARFNNSQKSYTYRTSDDVKPGDIVVDKRGAKLTVVDDWAEVYAGSNIAEVKKYVEPEKAESEE